VVLTDINDKALRCARDNSARNGEQIHAASVVARLDWAEPPVADRSIADADSPVDDRTHPALLGVFDVLLAADVVNADGLPQLVMNMLDRYLSKRGLFLMVAPRPEHRHKVDELRAALLASDAMDVRVVVVPRWLSAAIEEAVDIIHELYVVTWRVSRSPRS